ncbi:MAG: DUF86 domain-containing protein [Cyclobacteriaceae bacterium]
MSYDQFIGDSKTPDITVRNIRILVEAAYQVHKSYQTAHQEIEGSKIVRMRHILLHEYFDLDYGIIWKMVKESLSYHTKPEKYDAR